MPALLPWTFLILGSLICAYNWMTIYWSRQEGRFISPVFAAGALLLGLGMIAFDGTRPFAWLAIVADYGTLSFLIAAPSLLRQFRSTSAARLVRVLCAEQQGRSVELRLYREAIFVIELRYYAPPAVANEHGALIENSGFQGTWKQEEGDYLMTGYAGDRVLRLTPRGDRHVSQDSGGPADPRFPYDALDGLEFVAGTAR